MIRHENLKRAITEIVDSPIFEEMIESIKLEITHEMLEDENSSTEKRDSLYYEYKAVDKIKGRLIAIANEIRVLKPREVENV